MVKSLAKGHPYQGTSCFFSGNVFSWSEEILCPLPGRCP